MMMMNLIRETRWTPQNPSLPSPPPTTISSISPFSDESNLESDSESTELDDSVDLRAAHYNWLLDAIRALRDEVSSVTLGPGRDERRLESWSEEDEEVSEKSDTKGFAA